jgi:outer membrane protein assembly factor BamB
MFSLIPTRDGFVQFASHMLEEHITTRSGMKPAAGEKSVLNGTLNASKGLDAANEILNDMQRDRGGDVLQEDESKYLVKLRSPDGKNEWSGEVIGPPQFYPCKTVNVIAANKTVIVLDKNNRKLWQSSLQYNVTGAARDFEDADGRSGEGPCVEGKDSMYLFDQGMLTAFDLSNGNARWRLQSVGISSLFLDSDGMIYINTTDAGPDNLKYSRQIDVSRKTQAVAQKIDPKNGKVLWTAFPGGPISYVLGKFIYTVQYYDPGDPEDESPYTPDTGLETPPYLKIKLLNPKNGHEVWEHWQQRAPLDVQFENNTIRLVFRKEVQVLKFLTL